MGCSFRERIGSEKRKSRTRSREEKLGVGEGFLGDVRWLATSGDGFSGVKGPIH